MRISLPVIFKVWDHLDEVRTWSNSLAELDTWPCRNVAKPANIANDFNDTGGNNRSSIISTNRSLNWMTGKSACGTVWFQLGRLTFPHSITNRDRSWLKDSPNCHVCCTCKAKRKDKRYIQFITIYHLNVFDWRRLTKMQLFTWKCLNSSNHSEFSVHND